MAYEKYIDPRHERARIREIEARDKRAADLGMKRVGDAEDGSGMYQFIGTPEELRNALAQLGTFHPVVDRELGMVVYQELVQ